MTPLTCRCGLTLAEHHANFGCRRDPIVVDTYEQLLERITGRPVWPQPPAAEIELQPVVIQPERRTA